MDPASPGCPLKIVLVGVAGTSRDILLSVFALKSVVEGDLELRTLVDVEVVHLPYILPEAAQDAAQSTAEDILVREADIVGFSTYTWNLDLVSLIARLVREEAPSVRLVFGGPEIAGGDVLAGRFDELSADALIVGEGEVPFLAYVREACGLAADGKGEPPRTARRVRGRFEGETVVEPALGLVEELSALPSPYLTGAVPDGLLARPGIQASIETQRGCNFHCAYCLYHANYGHIRYRDPEVVLREFEYLQHRGVRHVRVADANFLSRKSHAMTILQGLVDRRLTLSLFVEVIPSYLDEDIARVLKEYREISASNDVLAGVGLQTTNERSLRAIHRRIPLRHFERAYDLLLCAGATIKTDVILGLPQETRDSYLATLEFVAERLRSGPTYLSIAVLRALPGTELADLAGTLGLTIEDDADHFVHETPTLPRRDLVDCMRISTVAVRVLHTLDDAERIRLRERYFEVYDALGVSHGELLSALARALTASLGETAPMADFAQDDFPRAEHYWHFDVYRDVSDELVEELLTRLATAGLPAVDAPPGRRGRHG